MLCTPPVLAWQLDPPEAGLTSPGCGTVRTLRLGGCCLHPTIYAYRERAYILQHALTVCLVDVEGVTYRQHMIVLTAFGCILLQHPTCSQFHTALRILVHLLAFHLWLRGFDWGLDFCAQQGLEWLVIGCCQLSKLLWRGNVASSVMQHHTALKRQKARFNYALFQKQGDRIAPPMDEVI